MSGHPGRRVALLIAWGAAAWLAAGCGGGGGPSAATPSSASLAPAAAPAPAVAAKPGAPAALPKEPEAGPPLPPLSYEARGRRDPFVPIAVGKDKGGISVSTMRLGGIVRGRGLLALVEAPDGLGYIVKPGDALGDGRVTDITPNSVTFQVAGKPGQAATTVTLKLAAE